MELVGDERETLKYLYVLVIFALCQTIFCFIHECGHAIVGMLFGLHLDEFVFGPAGGHVIFTESGFRQNLPVSCVVAIFLAGGIFEIIAILAISKVTWKAFSVLAIGELGYCLWEGGRGFILTISPLPMDMYSTYMELMGPAIFAATVLMIVYMNYRLKQEHDRILEEYRKALWAELYMR